MGQGGDTDRAARVLEDEIRSEKLTFSGTARWYIGIATTLAILLAVNQLFNLRIGGSPMLEGTYLYLLAGVFLSITFLAFRITGLRSAEVPLYDWLLAVATLLIGATSPSPRSKVSRTDGSTPHHRLRNGRRSRSTSSSSKGHAAPAERSSSPWS